MERRKGSLKKRLSTESPRSCMDAKDTFSRKGVFIDSVNKKMKQK